MKGNAQKKIFVTTKKTSTTETLDDVHGRRRLGSIAWPFRSIILSAFCFSSFFCSHKIFFRFFLVICELLSRVLEVCEVATQIVKLILCFTKSQKLWNWNNNKRQPTGCSIDFQARVRRCFCSTPNWANIFRSALFLCSAVTNTSAPSSRLGRAFHADLLFSSVSVLHNFDFPSNAVCA